MGKSQFSKIYIIKKHKKTKREKKMKWTGLYWPNYKAGLSPAAWAGLMFQPETKRGWTQPSRTGWADVPARSKKGLDSAQPRGLG
jgi:hypothetical protein